MVIWFIIKEHLKRNGRDQQKYLEKMVLTFYQIMVGPISELTNVKFKSKLTLVNHLSYQSCQYKTAQQMQQLETMDSDSSSDPDENQTDK